jgi:RNA 3'-terminal phosphate cyclase
MREGLNGGPREGRAAVEIDGAHGEGGGQILRTSLALALITGRPLRMRQIRAGRAKPGLRRQHLACVEAAARLCHAEVRGAVLGSQDLELVPGPITGGELVIDIGTAGSTTLVVQTILVPALVAGLPLRAVIRGGTHNPLAPPFEFLERVYLPHLRAMGGEVSAMLDRHGFASGGGGSPARNNDRRRDSTSGGRERKADRGAAASGDYAARGRSNEASDRGDDASGDHAARGRSNEAGVRGDAASGDHAARERARKASDRGDHASGDHGQLTLEIGAGAVLRPIEILEAGPVTARRATAILARLPSHVGEREHAIVRDRLGFTAAECEVREVTAGGPANVLLLEIERGPHRELVSAFGEKGVRAELVAARACDELEAFLAAGVPVGEHLADQLLLPLAVAGGGRFRAARLSLHATTNIATIQQFLDMKIRVEPDGDAVIVAIG